MKLESLAVLLLASSCAFGCTAMDAAPSEELQPTGTAADAFLRGSAGPSAGPAAGPSITETRFRAFEEPAADEATGPPYGPSSARRQDPAEHSARQVIYSADLRLVVVSLAEALAAVHDLASELGGYLQESDAHSITVRVPSRSFESAIERIEKLGELLDKSVSAEDVTEELFDLELRLDNARRARERLLAHLAKSEKVEDTLKIEAELTRVSGEIERLEGRQRFLSTQVAMSTIRAEFNAPTPVGKHAGLGLPFAWIERLGDGLLAGTVEALPQKPRLFHGGPRFTPPPEFLRYYSSSTLVEALNAEGVRIKVQSQENFDEGPLAFWSKLARRALVESRALAIEREEDLGEDRAWLSGTRDVARQPFGYCLMLARTKERVYTFEAWGPLEFFAPLQEQLKASAKSLRR